MESIQCEGPKQQAARCAVAGGRMYEDSPIYLPGFIGAVAAPSEKHATYIAIAMKAVLETAEREKELRRRHDSKSGILFIGDITLTLSTQAIPLPFVICWSCTSGQDLGAGRGWRWHRRM